MTSAPATEAVATAWRASLMLLAAAAIIRLLLAAIIPLFPDEAYYWDWSRHLSAGYFDHPPGIPLLIRAGTAIGGLVDASASPFFVRLFPVLAGSVATLATTAAARQLAGDRAALTAAIIITCLPLAATGLILATPDSPLLATTAVGLYVVVRAVQSPPGSTESLRWWSGAGLALGMAFASKYTSILLPVGVTIAVVSRGDLRKRLAEPGPYVACLLATLVFLPVLCWNSRHDWISFAFQLGHGLGPPTGSPLKRELDLIGGQAALVSPILFGLLAIAVWRGLRNRAPTVEHLLAVVAGVSFAFFVVTALRRGVEVNWPAPAYIPAIPLLAAQPWRAAARRWIRAGYTLAGAMSTLIYIHSVVRVLPIPPRKDPIARAFGWSLLGSRLAVTAESLGARTHRATWLGADRYQDAAEVAVQLPAHPVTFSMNLSGRRNQYDLWRGFAQTATIGDNLILVLDETREPHSTAVRLSPYFDTVKRGALVELRRGKDVITARRLWLLIGWKGGWPN